MAPTQHKLEFLEDRALLMISSLGLVCVAAAVFWVVRQSPDWARGGADLPGGDEDAAGDGAMLGARTRVVPGGRAATKASRKEAKKRAKAEFNRSRQALEGHERRIRLQDEKRRQGQERARVRDDKGDGHGNNLSSIDLARRRLEHYVLDHKVSSLEDLEVELNLEGEPSMSSAEMVTTIEELENGGHFTGIWINDARGVRSFVRASLDELRSVASFINNKGRLTVEELAIETNRVLGISPLPEEGSGGRGEGVEVDDDNVSDGAEDFPRGGGTDLVPCVGAPVACEAATGTDASNAGCQEDRVPSKSMTPSEEVANPGSLRRRH